MNYFLSIIAFVAVIALGYQNVYAGASVFYVKKSLMMENDEIPVHDYYFNAGKADGLKRGMVVKVYRKIPFQDTGIVKLNEELEVEVVELKLIHVQNKLSVGRLHRSLIGKNSPVLDYKSIMIGDQINVGSKRWPAKNEKSVAQQKPRKTQSKPEGQASFSSKAPVVKPKQIMKETAKQQAPVEVQQDDRAANLPIGGEFQKDTL